MNLRWGKLSGEDVHHLLSIFAAYVFAALIAGLGYRKRSLSKTGAIAAFLVGVVVMTTGFEFGIILLLFFVSSSFLTKLGGKRKSSLEDGHKEGGQRNWEQVVANSLFACMLCILHKATISSNTLELLRQDGLFLNVHDPQFLWHSCVFASFISFFSCTNGDTWASEIGILTSSRPFHVILLKRVPRGTNGGVSFAGTMASVLAGVIIGFPIVMMYPSNWRIIFVTVFASTAGSFLDSVFGGLWQYSGYCPLKQKVVNEATPFSRKISGRDILDNHQVNFLSATFTAIIGGIASMYIL